jgi:hypothetical protein
MDDLTIFEQRVLGLLDRHDRPTTASVAGTLLHVPAGACAATLGSLCRAGLVEDLDRHAGVPRFILTPAGRGLVRQQEATSS